MSRKLSKFIIYDIKNGLLKKWSVFLVTILASVIAIENVSWDLRRGWSGLDIIFNIFSGMPRFYIAPDTIFNIPFLWFVFMIIPSFLIGCYAVDDLNAYGIQMIVKSRSKLSWWISKTIWCLLSVVSYFVVIIAVMGIYSGINNIPFADGGKRWCEFIGIYKAVPIKQLVLHGIAVPALTIFTLCMVQMLLSIIFGSLTAYVVIIVYDILSAYITYPVFIGNYSMLLRDSEYVSDGIDIRVGIVIELVLIVASFVAGIIVMKKTALFKYSKNITYI